jgi:hypothetical protein
MRTKAKTALITVVAFWLIGLIVWPGCATPPLPSLREPIASRKTTDFKFFKAGQISRSEIAAKLGEPDEYFDDLRVAIYRINKVTGRKIWLCLGVIPIMVNRFPAGVEVALIQFDKEDRAQRFTISTTQRAPRFEAEDWVNKGWPKKLTDPKPDRTEHRLPNSEH